MRSVRYYIYQVFGKIFAQIYKALYGDAILVSLWEPQIWRPETNKSVCLWVFLQNIEYITWGIHKDKSNIHSETRNV